MHPPFLILSFNMVLGKKIGVVFFMTSEHWKIYPYLAGEAFQGLGKKYASILIRVKLFR